MPSVNIGRNTMGNVLPMYYVASRYKELDHIVPRIRLILYTLFNKWAYQSNKYVFFYMIFIYQASLEREARLLLLLHHK